MTVSAFWWTGRSPRSRCTIRAQKCDQPGHVGSPAGHRDHHRGPRGYPCRPSRRGWRHLFGRADISEFADVYANADSTAAYNRLVREGQYRLRHLARPTMAVIRGACVGGGCGLALACDLRFAAQDARFAITPARLGLAYSYADTAQLVEKVGPSRAKDILFSGRFLDAAEALSIGLVDQLAEPDRLSEAVFAYAAGLVEMSQVSIRAAKTMINALVEASTTPAMEALAADAFDGADFREGFQAFLGKRKPVFR